MAKRRKYITIAASAAAIILILVGLYFFIKNNRSYKPETEITLSTWYVNDDNLWSGFEEGCKDFNENDGEKLGIKISPRAFESAQQMQDTVEAGEEKPDIIICDTDYAAYLKGEGKLADINALFENYSKNDFNADMLAAATMGDDLLGLPIASEAQVFIVNKAKFADTDSLRTFEQLCSCADEYYGRNQKSFFTISNYSLFFRDALAQLGEKFDGVSPHDTQSENCKHVYRLLAQTAYNRGFRASGGNAVEMLANGDVAAAIVSSAELMPYADKFEGKNFEFLGYPRLKDGKSAFTQRVICATIFDSDAEHEKSAAEFLRRFVSVKNNQDFVGTSGYLPAIGTHETEGSKFYSALMSAVDDEKKAGTAADITPNSQYSQNVKRFNEFLDTIMESLD